MPPPHVQQKNSPDVNEYHYARCTSSNCTPGRNSAPTTIIARCVATLKRILWINFAVVVAVSVDQTRIILHNVLLTITKLIRSDCINDVFT